MSTRKKTTERCTKCLMRLELCICSLIPQIELETRLIVIGTKRELITPTNTGRLATQALTNSVLLTTGDQDRPFDIRDHLMPHAKSIILYPSEDAELLDSDYRSKLKEPVNLIVPDGNWRQTSKMRRRIPHLIDLPTVKVPLGELTQYRVRKESKEEGLATIEAIARAMGALEGAHVQKQLEDLMQEMVSRTLKSRGISQD